MSRYLNTGVFRTWTYKISCILIISICPAFAFAASGSVSASVGATTVTLNATGSFIVDTHCDPNDATNCWNHSGGSMGLLLNGGNFQSASVLGGSGSINATLNRATQSNGLHTATVNVSDAHGSSSNATTYTIDNTPTLSFSSPTGTIRGGPTGLIGSVQFVGGSGTFGQYGNISVQHRASGAASWSVSQNISSNTPTFDLSQLTGLPTHAWPDGLREIRVRAIALNGTVTEKTNTITINNTPIVNFTSPSGITRGGPTKLSGSVEFPLTIPIGTSSYGSISVQYRATGTTTWHVWSNTSSNIPTFDLSQLTGLPTHAWPDGPREIRVRALALSGAATEQINTITINNSPEVVLSLSANQIGDCENITGSINVISYDSNLNGGLVMLTLPDGTSTSTSFTGGTGTLTFADFGLPNGYSAAGFANQTMNFLATVTTAENRTNSHASSVSVVACSPSPADIDQANLSGPDSTQGGPVCVLSATANPIYFMTGDKEQVDSDFSIGGLSLTRSYHSRSTYAGRMGYGWSWSYGWKLTPPTTSQITIRRADGKLMVFNDDGTGTYIRQLERMDETVTATPTGYRYTHHDHSTVDFDAAGKLVSLNSEDGLATTVAYDVLGNPVSITDPHGRSVAVAVDVGGHIASMTGPTGRVWSYAYDVNNNLTSVTHPDGTSRQYVYADANDIHNLTQVIDEAGRIYKQVTYDAQDRATTSALPLINYQDAVTYNLDGTVSVTESDGRVITYTIANVNGLPYIASRSDCACGTASDFTYDAATGSMLSSSDKLGVSNSYTYDTNGRLLTSTEAVGTAVQRTTTYIYDGAGHVASVTDALLNTTSYTYDISGRRITSTDALGNITTNTWNIDGTLASRTAADGGVTSYTYDGLGQVIQVTNPDLTRRSMMYDAAGRIVSLTDESGSTTAYTYDTRDRVLFVTYADGTSTTNSYDAVGDLVSSTDSAGLITTYTYDVEHRPVSVTRPDGTTVNSTFDTKGNLTARDVLDAAGISALRETMAYDGDGRLVSTTHADATSSSNSYDMVGRLLTATDEAGKVSSNTYDELGRLIATTNANGEIATYAYDAADHLIQSTAANGVVTTFAFDAAGRLIQETSSDRGFTTYSYNAAGDLIAKVDGLSVVTGYTYDANHRMTGISYAADPSRNVSFTYDVAGRLNGMTDVAGITGYTHDTMGRVTSAAWTPTASTLTLTLAYGYDASGRISTLTYPTGRVVTYNYDTAGRIGSVDASANGSPVNLASTITYDALGNIISRTLGNGVLETRSIDSRGRVVTIDAAGVLNRSLTWSADSTITAITDGINPAASQSFVYDFADRLASAAGGYGSISYTYDANGNRTSKTDAGGTVSSSYEAATNRLASSGATTYTRDAAGNRLSDGTINYTYAVNNRLIAVADAAGVPLAGYQHNGKGERVSKTVNGVTTWYLYDLSGNLIGEYDSNGVMIAEHLYGPSGRIVTIRNESRPVVLNQTNLPTTLYAGLFGLWERFTFVAEAGRRLS